MFGIGAFEFFLIGIVALLAIGPGEMPRALYSLGRMMRKMRQFSADIQSGLDKFTEDAALDDIAREANKAGDEMMDFRIEQQQALEMRDKPKSKPKTKKTSGQNSKKKKPAKASQSQTAVKKTSATKKSVTKKSATKKKTASKSKTGDAL